MVPRRSQRYSAENVSDLDFADGILELEESQQKLQIQLDLPGLTPRKSIYTYTLLTKTNLTSDFRRQLDCFQTSCPRISYFVSRVEILLEMRKFLPDRTGTVLLFQSVKARQIGFLGHSLRRAQGDLISIYALRHPTQGKQRPGPGRKVIFHEYATKIINPEYPPFLTKCEHWRRIAKNGSTWRRDLP